MQVSQKFRNISSCQIEFFGGGFSLILDNFYLPILS